MGGVVLVVLLLVGVGYSCRSGGGPATDPTQGSIGTAVGTTAPPTIPVGSRVPTTPAPWQSEYLACVRESETGDNYQAVSPDGGFFGAYQIDQVTWNNTVQQAGIQGAFDVQPNEATPAVQDEVALALLNWQGTTPWKGDC